MRFHIVNLVHTQTTQEFCPCAYTAKVVKFCAMMKSLGHTVYLYASEDNDAECDELIACITKKEQIETLGNNDWKKTFFNVNWDPNHSSWQIMNGRVIEEMKKRIEEKDFICLIGGNCQMQIAHAFPAHISVEFGIGYRGVFSNFKVFESYSWMHHVYGLMKQDNGSWYDAVIPNYFDVNQFELRPKKDYYLYFGRLITRKGLRVVQDIADRLKIKVLCVGQGKLNDPGSVDNCGVTSPYLEHIGSAGVEERKILMAEAKACFLPTYYLEPFGGVAVEAQLSGTPVITSDWGAFPETVQHGKTGYRCRTLEQFVWATKNADKLDPLDCRKWAVENYGMDKVKNMYQEYFSMLSDLYGKGWYEENDSRNELSWLEKTYV